MKTLLGDYTVLELDRGDEIQFHPCTGRRRLNEEYFCAYPNSSHDFAVFCPAEHTYVSSQKKWPDVNSYYDEDWPRIGDGTPCAEGDNYLPHWLYDPYTGVPLFDAAKLQEEVRGLFRVLRMYVPHVDRTEIAFQLEDALRLAHYGVEFNCVDLGRPYPRKSHAPPAHAW